MSDLDKLMTYLPSLGNIKMLYLNGNPCCLVNKYREITLAKIPTLLILDDIKKMSEREARKKMKEQMEKEGLNTQE